MSLDFSRAVETYSREIRRFGKDSAGVLGLIATRKLES